MQPDFEPETATEAAAFAKFSGIQLAENKITESLESGPADLHRNLPRPSEAMLYGLCGDVGRASSATSEANRFAVAGGFLTFLSAAVGRDVYLPIGDTKHHIRLFSLHVGRTSRGRKGDALSLIKRIHKAIEERHQQSAGSYADPFCGGTHFGGLSSREGLALLIHDGFTQGKEEVPPIKDKRLWIIESEFANILHQAKRDGNTLSAALRDAWDGIGIRPATKTARLWASDPHIALSAAITPSELTDLMQSRELSNGFANRFLIYWAERDRKEPFPMPTSAHVIDDLARRTIEVIKFAVGRYPETADSRAIGLSADARTEYAALYNGELSALSDGEKITALLERRPPILLRLAGLFALTDLTLTIEVKHLHAALAWSRYHQESVRFIFNDAVGESNSRESTDAASVILAYLGKHGKTSRTDLISKCFGNHLHRSRLDEALDFLLMDCPPAILITEEGKGSAGGRPKKFYSLTVDAKYANNAKFGADSGVTNFADDAKYAKFDSHSDQNPEHTSQTSHFNKMLASRADSHTSHTSHTSHLLNDKSLIECDV